MALTLYVDGPRWRAHLDRVVAGHPGIVPVVKGNGYGFGLARLLAECARLAGAGVAMVAVGTYAEAPVALAGFPGDVLVLEPYRGAVHGAGGDAGGRDAADRGGAGGGDDGGGAGGGALRAPALVHTVTSAAELERLVGVLHRPRVVLEALTSMNRHGMARSELRDCVAALRSGRPDAELVGVTLHLPLGTGHVEEVEHWLAAVEVPRWFLSHVSWEELALLRGRHPQLELRPRVGTVLWLGDEGAVQVRAHVMDVRPVLSGERAGYRQRRLGGGHLLVVSGGTAHGVALEAPSAAATPRQRAIALAEGVLEAAGRVRSPFVVAGRSTRFVEPPHMQVSLVTLPEGAAVPAVGDEVRVRVRHTTVHPDAVVIS